MPGRVFSEEEVRRMSEPGAMPNFGAPVDPLRPQDLAVPPGPAQKPPTCPKTNHLLQPVDTNKAGDVLFECMTCGYDAVYRTATNTFEQRPNRPQDPTWRPPVGWGTQPVATTKTDLQPTRAAAKRRRRKPKAHAQRPRGPGGKFMPKGTDVADGGGGT